MPASLGPAASVRDALATYLQAQLVGTFPTLKTHRRWPTPGQVLAPYAISVLLTGPPKVSLYPPMEWTNSGGDLTYSYGRADFGMQLDCWATYEDARDALAEAMRKTLNQSPRVTLSISGATTDAFRYGGLVIPVTGMSGSPRCEYMFSAIPMPIESSNAAQAEEWRATWDGTAVVHLTDLQQVAAITELSLIWDSETYTV